MSSPVTITQTYSTSETTHNAKTATLVGDLVATNNGWGANSEANFDKIATAIDALIADVANVSSVLNAVIDALQLSPEIRVLN